MAISKAQQKAVAKYDSKAYDKTLLRLPKGRLDVIRAHAEARSESVNGFIGRAITEAMARDGADGPQEAAWAGVVSLPPDALKAAQRAAEATGEARYTFADVLAWDEHERAEIINGEAVMMAPPTSDHQEISMELSAQLHAYLKGKKCKVYAAPFAVRLFEKDGDSPEDVGTIVEPDISVVCDPGKIDKHGCKGAPDMAVEILSPSTQRHDRFTKFNLYQRAGVLEYWIVDPHSRVVQSFVLEDGRYSVKEFGTARDKMKVNVLKDCVIDLSEVFPS